MGFDEQTIINDRAKEIEAFIKKYWPSKKTICIDHFYKGPYNERIVSRNSYAEFANPEDVKQIIKSIKDEKLEFKIDSKALSIKQARTQLNTTRNSSLRSAEKAIKESDKARDKEVKIEWKDRTVLCGGIAAFRQEKNELTGSFLDPFSSLILP